MTIEAAVAALTTATTTLTDAVLVQRAVVDAAIGGFAATTTRVNALSNVDNTTDANKPVSTAQGVAIGLKQNALVSGTTIRTVNGLSLLGSGDTVIPRGATSLTTIPYSNIAELRSILTTPAADDSMLIEEVGLFQWYATRLFFDDGETAINTLATSNGAIGQWRLKVPGYDLLQAWDYDEQLYEMDLEEDEPTRIAHLIAAGNFAALIAAHEVNHTTLTQHPFTA